jgi:cation:H+ antiporter
MIEYILFVVGLILLLKGADYLVDGSCALAKKLGIPTLVIGLTIVAFGTSAPELVVNIMSAINGAGEVSFGNIIGSNMANLLLILGISAAITSLKVQRSTIWKEIPLSLFAVVLLIIFSALPFLVNASQGYLSRIEGFVLIFFFILFMIYTINLARKNKPVMTNEEANIKIHSNLVIGLMIIGGLIALYYGGKWVVDGAVMAAKAFGLSEFLISATIIAVGTSLPELITSIVAAMKNNPDLAIGNIVGSNIFNIFWILGLTAVISPIKFPLGILFDLICLLCATALFFIFMFIGKKHELKRWQGWVFIILYILYVYTLIRRG